MKSIQFRIKNNPLTFKKRQEEAKSKLHQRTYTAIQNDDYQHQKMQQNSISDIMEVFKKMMAHLEGKERAIERRKDLEVRDRHYILPVPQGISYEQKKQSIKKWLEKMVSNIVSIAFNYFLNQQITHEQAKIYCSDNILKNIAALNQKYQLKTYELKEVDEYIQDDVINYLLKKYPMTESIIESKSLGSMAKASDETQKRINDFLDYGEIRFEVRESQNYEDLIKQLINQIIYRTNHQSNILPGTSNFSVYHKMMTKIFELVEDKDWMQDQKSSKKTHAQQLLNRMKGDLIQELSETQRSSHKDMDIQNKKIEYRQKVRQYTNYLIGRKISQHVSGYSDQEIKNKTTDVKSPAILRILTKWCQELWKKFIPKNYYLNKTEDFKLINGEIKSLSPEMRSQLDKIMQIQKIQIKKFMAKMVKQNSEVQLNLLNQLLQNSDEQFWEEDLQRISGKFSVLVGKSLQKRVVKYLNRLIHGLLKVADKFQKQCLPKEWSSPPNLITFRLGDIMRCKCSSGERQILRIFKEIKCLSDQNPQIIKIIRIKNRLSLGTNDILINVRFSNLIVCQIQLAVNSRKSKFIKSSNYISHYLYEVQRSLFGPINELCSIWRNLDMRSLHYDNNMSKQIGEGKIAQHKCQTHKKQFQLQVFDGPFICNICNTTYSENNLILKHLKCSQCAYWKCGKCQIILTPEKLLTEMLIESTVIKPYCMKKYMKGIDSGNLPSYGIAIKLNASVVKPIIFKKMLIRGADCLFTLENNQIVLVNKLINEAAEQKFADEFLIFQISEDQGQNLIDLSEDRVRQEYLLPAHISQCYKQHKNGIILQQQPLNSQNCSNIFKGTLQQRQTIQQLQFSNVSITNIQPLTDLFPALQRLQLRDNSKLTIFQGISNFNKLKTLSIKHMIHLQEIPSQIFSITSLQILQLKDNNFQTIPEEIQNLTILKELDLSRLQGENFKNNIRVLPTGIYTLRHLQRLDLSYLWIGQLHADIQNLKELTYLNIKRNNIKVLPDSINNLLKLEYLNISRNPFEYLPQSMSNLNKLKRFQFKQIGGEIFNVMGDQLFRSWMKSLPNDLEQIQNLVTIDLHSQQLQQLPSLNKCLNLQELNLQRCSLSAFPQLPNCNKLKRLNLKQQLNTNQLVDIPNELFPGIPNLQYFCVSYNRIQTIPANINMLLQLKQMNLQVNNIESLPQEIGQCASLKKINLWRNNIKDLPSSLQYLLNLQYINVAQNGLTIFPESVTNCINLRQIIFYQNTIQAIPQNIMNLVNLQILDLERNLIQIVPSCLRKLKKIKKEYLKLAYNPIYLIECSEYLINFGCVNTVQLNTSVQSNVLYNYNNSQKVKRISPHIKRAVDLIGITLSHNQLTYFPEEITELTKLQTCQFDDNLFENFPCSITRCKNIKKISFQDNAIVCLPDQVGNLQNLTFLNAYRNKIEFISDKINQCANLTEICLESNQLQQLSPNTFVGLNKLTKINLSGNKIEQFPAGLLQCPNIQQIQIAENQIFELTADFSKMMQLKTLDLSWNKIKTFPDSLILCPTLQRLSISNNQIQILNQKIYQFRTLTILDLNKNKIRNIPRPQQQCKILKSLYLAGNLIETVIAELSLLKSIHPGQLNLYNNPLKQVLCWSWAKEFTSPATQELIIKLKLNTN